MQPFGRRATSLKSAGFLACFRRRSRKKMDDEAALRTNPGNETRSRNGIKTAGHGTAELVREGSFGSESAASQKSP